MQVLSKLALLAPGVMHSKPRGYPLVAFHLGRKLSTLSYPKLEGPGGGVG